MKTKLLNTKTEEIGERTVRFIISSEVKDRDGDILVSKGCDFTNYEKNPVFLSFHNSREYPLGKVVKYWAEEKAVYADVYFPTIEELSTDPKNASEKAKLVDFTYHCYKTGMLNAVSVGFIAKEYEPIIEDKKTTGYLIIKWELLEFSAVAVPANQDAIAQASKSFGEDKAKGFIDPIERIKECEQQIAEFKEKFEKEIDIENINLSELKEVEQEIELDEMETESDDEINLDDIEI